MPIYLQIIIYVLGAAIMIYLFIKNQALTEKVMSYEGDLELANYDLGVAREEIEDYQLGRQQDDATIIDLQKESKRLRRDAGKAKRERDDAMTHLEKTLESSAFDHQVPQRIHTEVGRDGIYYVLSYDPPKIDTTQVKTLVAVNQPTSFKTIFNDDVKPSSNGIDKGKASTS